jgi:hypothetical protein
MESAFDYYKFREQQIIGKITAEIDFFEKNGLDYCNNYPIKNYLDYLKERIGVNEQETKSKNNRYRYGYDFNIVHGLKTMDMNEYNKDMDINSFKRPWKKLREIHKIIKINEYVQSLPYDKKIDEQSKETNQKYLTDELCKGLKNKRFTKDKTTINYNEEEMLIKSISCIIKKKELYTINWNM